MRHPVRVVNPKETRNQPCPVFPNRTPGRQPSISHGCKVAGSTFWLFLKFQRRLRIAHQNWTRRSMYGFRCLRQMCAHCTWCNILSALSFCVSPLLSLLLANLRAARSGWSPSVLLTGGSVDDTCDRRLLQLACRSLCIPPPTADAICLLASTTATSRAWLPHRCGGGELRLRNFGGRLGKKRIPSPPKDKNRGGKTRHKTSARRNAGRTSDVQKSLTAARALRPLASAPENCSQHTHTHANTHTDTLWRWTSRSAPRRSSPVARGDGAMPARWRGSRKICSETGALCHTAVFQKKKRKGKKKERKYVF